MVDHKTKMANILVEINKSTQNQLSRTNAVMSHKTHDWIRI